eukprot:COSAG04_NODE_919_length_9421_cov_5.695130_8_plen_526_part_00
MSASKFQPIPAETPIPAPTAVQAFQRRQVFPRAPVTGAAFVGGKEAQFSFRASGTDCLVCNQSRLVLKCRVRSDVAANGNDLGAADGAFNRPPSAAVRLAQDPVARAFSSARCSIGGVTITNTGADLQDVATLIGRTQGTVAGGEAGGSLGCLGFDDRLHHNDLVAGGATVDSYHETASRNPKHTVLQDSGGQEFEISTPLGNLIPFMMQDQSYLRDCELDMRFVVSSHFKQDMIVTKALPAAARAQGVVFAALPQTCQTAAVTMGGAQSNGLQHDGLTATAVIEDTDAGWNGFAAKDRTFVQLRPAIDAAAADSHTVTVTDCFIDACYATPSAPLPPLRSMQLPFSDITLYTRPLVAGSTTFNETFSGVPPSTSAIIIALREDTHTLAQDRERYLLGGSATGIKNLQLSAGQYVAPSPSYELNLPQRKAGRAFADFVDFVGGTARDGAGGFSYNEFCDAPCFSFRLLQPKGTYSPTITARLELLGNAAANSQLMVACVHSRVCEMYWQDGGSLPSKVTIDEVVA